MIINSLHPDYTAKAPEWQRARDVLAGEDAIKAAAEKYLPRLHSQTDEDYSVYQTRASFFGATAHTLAELSELVFRRAPVLGPAAEPLRPFLTDCDLRGLDFLRYSRSVLDEVLAVGRAASLVLWASAPPSGRPVVSLWKAEDILNWQVQQAAGRVELSQLLLRDGDRRLLFRLEDGKCAAEVWTPSGDDFLLSERAFPERNGVPLPFIPFVFHGPSHSRPEPDKLPLAEIIAANLDHYRLDADLKHGLHLAALPTAWVCGFDKSVPLRLGSTAAWNSDLPGASAGFLEFSGAGLAHLEKAIERVERRMALLGARMLEPKPAEPQTTLGQPGHLSGLGNLVASLNQSLTMVLHLARWWAAGGTLASSGTAVAFEMNTDLAATPLSGQDLSAIVAAWRAGAISRETMLELLKRGEILPDGRTVNQERALLHRASGAAVG